MVRILIVEDSSAMRSYIRAVLEEANELFAAGSGEVDVTEAASGFEALRLLPRGRYDLVITDINMPDINGLELIKFVRESEYHRDVPVMIISTQSSERDRARGMALGANVFLAKPFTRESLLNAVSTSLATLVARIDRTAPESQLAGSEGRR